MKKNGSMNKYFLFIVVFFASLVTISAQDVIVKKDGSTILSKVIEIGATEIKYKKWNNQNGPMYTIEKKDVQAINYENGEKEVFSVDEIAQPRKEIDYNSLMVEGIAANNKLQKEKLLASAESWRKVGDIWGWVCSIGGVGGGLLLSSNGGGESALWICMGAGLASGLIGGIICDAIAKNKEKAANSISAVPLIKKDFHIGNSNLSAGLDLMNNKITNDKALGIGLRLSF